MSTNDVMTISVIVPAYNEGENIDRVYDAVQKLFEDKLSDYRLEMIFSDNASTDDTYSRIETISAKDPRVRGIRLSRNFGFQSNILSGMLNATGDCVIQLDADGEDPPEMIATFVEKWREGYDVVYGIRKARQESFLLTLQRKLFYRMLLKMSSIQIPADAGDFRLLNRRVVDILCTKFQESNPYLRGLVSFVGLKQIGIPYQRNAREIGTSKFNFYSYFGLAWDAITSFSRTPLRLISIFGMVMSLFAFIGIVFYLTFYFFIGIPIQGFTTIVLLVLMLSGIQLLSLGIFGEYISRIFDEVKGRPRLIIDQYCGFEQTPSEHVSQTKEPKQL